MNQGSPASQAALTTLIDAVQAGNLTPWIAMAALAVSLMSLALAVLNYRRDRPKLKIEARLYRWDGQPGWPGYIEVKAVNAGRRPIFLVWLWGTSTRLKAGSGHAFADSDAGLKLGEHEVKSFRVTYLPREKDDHAAVAWVNDDIVDIDHMSIEDSLGNRYEIPNMETLLPQLRSDYGDWCEATGYWKSSAPVTDPTAMDEASPLE